MNELKTYIWPNVTGGPVIPDGQGIDYLIVRAGTKTVEVHFFEYISATLMDMLTADDAIDQKVIRIRGGSRIMDIRVTDIDISPEDDGTIDHITLTVNQEGDWSPYRLEFREDVWRQSKFDPVYSSITFNFKVDCREAVDCKSHDDETPQVAALKNFDYQSKDYESIKLAMFDRLQTTATKWWDRAEADFGVVLVDILAFVGDRLSYYQDRVAGESQLVTANLRESISKHLKLLDYQLDHGQTASTWIAFNVTKDMTIPSGTMVQTPGKEKESPIVYSLLDPLLAYKDNSSFDLHNFSHPSLYIPRGSLSITITDYHDYLTKNTPLIIWQLESDGAYRYHFVRLSSKPIRKYSADGNEVSLLTWDKEYALPWDLALANSHNRVLGNVALMHHGISYSENFYVDGDVQSYQLDEGPVAYSNGEPLITVKVDDETWTCVDTLKASRPYDRHYQLVDLENSQNLILFGDNECGLKPESFALVEIKYHTQIGEKGNLGAGTLTKLSESISEISDVVHPFAVTDGRDPETEENGKIWGPKMIRRQKRAVTPEDYAKEAMLLPGVQKAKARFVDTGSWTTVRVCVDPAGTETLSKDLENTIFEHLDSKRMAGYDLQIVTGRYIPLEIGCRFCLNDMAYRDQVLHDLEEAFGSGVSDEGILGFFHPDNWTFGQTVELSELYARIATIDGIESAEVVIFRPLGKPQTNEIESGRIPIMPETIAQCHSDRNFPEYGVMEFDLSGGR